MQKVGPNVASHLSNGVSNQVLERAFGYWRSIDKDIGDPVSRRGCHRSLIVPWTVINPPGKVSV